jgi:hypothetical protein
MRRVPSTVSAVVRGLLPLLGVTLAPACAVYDPKLVERDAGGMDAPEDAGPAMGSRQPPERPSTPDDGVDIGEVAFGLREVVLDQPGGLWRTIGFDLDRRYTTDATNTECTPPARVAPPVDGEEGIDNVFGASLYPLVELTVPGLEATARAAQEAGNGLPVLRIRRWNGTNEDSRIDAVVTTTVFTTSAEGAGPDIPPIVEIRGPRDVRIAGEPAPAPAWDGEDWAWVRSDSYVGGDLSRPLIRDDNAYVVDGHVVMRLPAGIDILFPADDTGVLVRLTQAVAVGRIDQDGNLENVVVAGRWSIVDLLSTAENVGICRGTPQYNILEGQLNRIADVRREPPRPGDPVLECDALSLGVTFRGTRIRIAGLTDGAPVLNQCIRDAGVPMTDAGVADAFVAPDAFAPDAFAPDAFAPDAFAPDAFAPDAFSPIDARF